MADKMADEEKDANWYFEEILRKINVFGYYNWRTMIILAALLIVNSSYCVNYVYVTKQIKYRCKYEECNPTFDFKSTNKSSTDDVCYRYLPLNKNVSTCQIEDYDFSQTVPCTEWIYENDHSFVAEFDLACQEWKRVLIGTIHSVGYMIGLIIVGPLSDRFGRKNLLISLTVTGSILGIAKSLVTNYWMYAVLELLEAIFGDSYSPTYMTVVELVPIEYRIIFCCFTGLADSLSKILISGIAWAIPGWRNAVRGIYAPGFIALIAIFLIDESPRWLLSKGRKDEAIAILKKAARVNNAVLDENSFKNLSVEIRKKENNTKGIIYVVFSSKTLLLRFLICVYLWNTCAFVSYGLLTNIGDLPGNFYVNNGLLSLLNVASVIIMYLFLTKFKRKKPLICGYMLTAMFCIIQPFLSKDNSILVIIFYLLPKLMNVCVFDTLYLFTTELFPTYIRNTMHALCSSIGRIGSIVGTQTPLLTVYWDGLPTLMFGSAAFIAAVLTMLIPDPSDEILPDNVTQAESLGKKKQTPTSI